MNLKNKAMMIEKTSLMARSMAKNLVRNRVKKAVEMTQMVRGVREIKKTESLL